MSTQGCIVLTSTFVTLFIPSFFSFRSFRTGCACNIMSLATQAFGQSAGSHVAHHDFKWTTGVFCYFLERAVDMMQSGQSIPEQILVAFGDQPKLQAFMKSFLELVWRCVIPSSYYSGNMSHSGLCWLNSSIHAGRIYMLACVGTWIL